MSTNLKNGSSASRPFAESKGMAIRVTLLILLCALALAEWNVARIGAMVAAIAAALAAGASLGFLFGIPRSLATATNVREGEPASGNGDIGSGFSHNTNLEQISDWLTKIVVGVSLVEARALFEHFDALAYNAAAAWMIAGGAVTAGALLLASGITGFLSCYIWTRTTFMQLLVYSDRRIAEERRGRLEAENRVREVVRAVGGGPALAKLDAADSAPRRSLSVSNGLKSIFGSDADVDQSQIRKSASGLWHTDPNKGAFGGQPAVDGRRLEADVVPLGNDGSICTVTLRVRAESGYPPVTGPVAFHLHPTFNQPVVVVSPSEFGVAELRVLAAGVFTVGVEIESEHLRLELDLASLPDLPEKFRDD